MLFPSMVSYAQNGEDVVLRRAFAGQATGFWVDVGACDPELDSVTLNLSRDGWRGINVEPDSTLHAKFETSRPRDINVHAAVGASASEITFFPTGTRGHGTLVESIARTRTAETAYSVQMMPLAALIDTYVPEGQTIDFLKIDVEGFERAVICSGDWVRHRPRLVIVEAVDELGRPTHQEWESILTEHNYVPSLFDGLNRWYCTREDNDLIRRTEAPANVLDNWMPFSQSMLLERCKQLEHSASTRKRFGRFWG